MSAASTEYLDRIPKRAWLIWATGMTFVLFQFTLQLGSGVLIEQLAISFQLSAYDAGIMSASYYYIYVLLQIPAGLLADRYGARLTLAVGSFACGLGCLMFASAETVRIAEAGRLLMGAGGALSYVGILFIVQHWFPFHRFALMVGLTEAVGLISTIGGSIYLADAIMHWGWRLTMNGAGIISIIIAIAIYAIVRDSPTGKLESANLDRRQFIAGFNALVRNTLVWLNGIYCGLVYTLVTVFIALWGVPFMRLKYDISLALSTTMNVSLIAGTAIMCPLIGWLAARFDCQRLLLVMGAALPAILMTLVIYTTPPMWLMFVYLIVTGMCITPYILNFAIADAIAPSCSRATSIGIANGLCMATAPIFQMLIGKLLDLHHTASDTIIVGQYDLSDYHFALATFPIILVIAAVIAMKLNVSSQASLPH